jgi:hypothetical protein
MPDLPDNVVKKKSKWSNLGRYCRFNLRFLLILMTVICVCFAYQLRRAERQKKGVEFVVNAGGSVRYDFQVDANGNFNALAESHVSEKLLEILGHDFFHTVVNVNLEKEGFSLPDFFSGGMESLFSVFSSRFSKDEPIRDLCKAFPKLEKLTIDKRHASNKHLEFVGKLSRLKSLSISNSKYITDEGIAHLRYSRSLETVYLIGKSRITDESLEVLSKLPKLRRINVQTGRISDVGIGHLETCENLTKAYFMPPRRRSLSLEEDPIEFTDKALQSLGSLSNLEVVGISSSLFTDEGVAHLSKLNNLHTLILRGPEEEKNSIGDAGLAHLFENKLLGNLDVSNSKVTSVGLQEFAKQNPACLITKNR